MTVKLVGKEALLKECKQVNHLVQCGNQPCAVNINSSNCKNPDGSVKESVFLLGYWNVTTFFLQLHLLFDPEHYYALMILLQQLLEIVLEWLVLFSPSQIDSII